MVVLGDFTDPGETDLTPHLVPSCSLGIKEMKPGDTKGQWAQWRMAVQGFHRHRSASPLLSVQPWPLP